MKITDAAAFGAALKARRRDLGYTQAYLSDVSGLSVSFISDLEGGKETAELGKVLLFASLLGMDVELLARGKDAAPGVRAARGKEDI